MGRSLADTGTTEQVNILDVNIYLPVMRTYS